MTSNRATIDVDSIEGVWRCPIYPGETTVEELAQNVGTRMALKRRNGRGHIHVWADKTKRIVGGRAEGVVDEDREYVFVGSQPVDA